MDAMEKRRLGRGLDSLLGMSDEAGGVATAQAEVPVASIQQNPYQPRKTFDADDLAALSSSVRTHGILQPLVVRQVGEQFQLIAGERRLRAAQEAGLATVPVRVVDFNDQQVVEAALVENIQRSDLNPIEKAQGFKDYLDRFGLNHEQLAKRLGLARSTISNLVNLLDLAPEVQEAVRTNQISEGHAKLLKGIKDHARQIALYKDIVAKGLSVKATDAYLHDLKEEKAKPEARRSAEEKTTHVKSLEEELRQKLATGVEIRVRGKDRGLFVIRFESNDDFMRLLEILRQ
jgi:ParB family chromosome partitioning protein